MIITPFSAVLVRFCTSDIIYNKCSRSGKLGRLFFIRAIMKFLYAKNPRKIPEKVENCEFFTKIKARENTCKPHNKKEYRTL